MHSYAVYNTYNYTSVCMIAICCIARVHPIHNGKTNIIAVHKIF